MSSDDIKESIIVIGPVNDPTDEDEWRGIRDKFNSIRIPPEDLEESAEALFSTIKSLFEKTRQEVSEYELSEVEINCTVTISGKLAIVGLLERGASGEGGIKLLFKRKQGQ